MVLLSDGFLLNVARVFEFDLFKTFVYVSREINCLSRKYLLFFTRALRVYDKPFNKTKKNKEAFVFQ